MPPEELPAGYRARALRKGDLPAVLDMITAASIADEALVRHTMHELEESYDTPGFDPASDTSMVLDASGGCAGLAEVYDLDEGHLQPRAYFQITPAHRSSGIHRHLLAFLDRRLREVAQRAASGSRVAAIAVRHPSNSPILDLMTEAGWRPIRHTWEMEIELPSEPEPAALPTGITIRTGVEGHDEEAVYRASEEAFADHFGFVRSTFDMWRRMVIDYGQSPPDLWILAETGPNSAEGPQLAGMVASSLRYRNEPATGYVGTLGVRRPYRRRGLGEALLRSAFGLLYGRGMRKVVLDVDSESLTGATRLYERVGMRVASVATMHELELVSGTT
jgi:mycothiol synthase